MSSSPPVMLPFARMGPSLVVAALLCTGAVQAQFFNCGPACHTISGNVYDGAGGPFLAGHVYLAPNDLQVPAGQTLTIHAGADIKFVTGYSFYV